MRTAQPTAPLLHIEVFSPEAKNPDPADGAQEVTSPLFQWTAGDGAVMHQVYIGTNPELTAADIAGAPMPVAMYFHVAGLTPGITYYWRVDETAADGTVTTGPVWSFTAMPLTAHFPTPADKATDVKTAGQLKWTAGQTVMGHMVYMSADKAAVETGAPSAQVAAGPDVKYDYTGLTPFTTYYWRVDEIGGTGQIVPGPVWSFSTVTYLSMADAAVTLNYNNSASPFTSQVTLTGAADWTAYGLSDLVVQFTGRAGPKGGLTYDEPNQTYTLAGSGTDIWNNGDQFRYAYKTLSGDGTMVARVDSIGASTNTWAKGGVMIRQSIAAGSTHAFMPITATAMARPATAPASSGGWRPTAPRRTTTSHDGRGSVLGEDRAQGQQLHRFHLPGRQDLDAVGHGPDDRDDRPGLHRPGRDLACGRGHAADLHVRQRQHDGQRHAGWSVLRLG